MNHETTIRLYEKFRPNWVFCSFRRIKMHFFLILMLLNRMKQCGYANIFAVKFFSYILLKKYQRKICRNNVSWNKPFFLEMILVKICIQIQIGGLFKILQLPAVIYMNSSNTEEKQIEHLLRGTYNLPLVAFYIDKLGFFNLQFCKFHR